MSAFEAEIRVRYQETDQMGVVYHANYLTWFEIGRTELIRELGVPYRRIEERGLLLPVIDLHVQFQSPARYDDRVLIRTRIIQSTGVRISFGYQAIRKETGELLASGETHHVWVNRAFRPVNLKKAWPELHALIEAQKEG